jgi:hypothetical protein
MLRQFGKMVGVALAMLCLVSTLAGAVEMTCRASDGKGNCTAGSGPDGKEVVVVGTGIAVGEKWTVSTKGPSSNAPRSSKVRRLSPVPVCHPLSLGCAVPGEEGLHIPCHDGACLKPRHTLHTTLGLAPPTASMLSSPPEPQQWRQALHSARYPK